MSRSYRTSIATIERPATRKAAAECRAALPIGTLLCEAPGCSAIALTLPIRGLPEVEWPAFCSSHAC